VTGVIYTFFVTVIYHNSDPVVAYGVYCYLPIHLHTLQCSPGYSLAWETIYCIYLSGGLWYTIVIYSCGTVTHFIIYFF